MRQREKGHQSYSTLKAYLQVSSSKVANYDYDYFSDETKLMELIQYGPVVTWFDVPVDLFRFVGEGIYYNPDLCGNNEVVLFILNFKKYICQNRMRLCPLSVSRKTGATPVLVTAKTRCPSTATGATKLFSKQLFR